MQMLLPDEKQFLEDDLIEGVTLQRLGREQDLDRRTIRKRIKRAQFGTGKYQSSSSSSQQFVFPHLGHVAKSPEYRARKKPQEEQK
jgi:hypothetical protein